MIIQFKNNIINIINFFLVILFFRGRLEVEMTLNVNPSFDLTSNPLRSTSNQTTTNNNNNNNNSNNTNTESNSSSSFASTTRTARNSQTDNLRSRQQQTNTSLDLETLELFNEIRLLFSSYLEKDELIRRIENLPLSANNSLSSFIDSMKISKLFSKDKSNITLELFLILAQKISVVEFLKIIFMQEFKCLNRAQDSMVNYARTNLLFSTTEPFDTSSCVDDLIKIWKKVLLNSFNELEFSERTFSALMSELRRNLSVFLRTFTRTFNNNDEQSSFAFLIYSAIQRLFLDFHTSLSQMFRNPNNLMRAYKNILVSTFFSKK